MYEIVGSGSWGKGDGTGKAARSNGSRLYGRESVKLASKYVYDFASTFIKLIET